ncbi:MAG: MGMT family protein, partial [Thermoproteota archaeon]
NQYPVIIPCHRVVKSDGNIGGYSYGQDVKTSLLSKEGIKIKNGKVLNFEKSVYRF